MSGLEVAGVVLGSLPVLAEAIDSWKAGRSQIGLWRNYGQSLNRLIGELQTQNVLFRDCMVSLLESAGVGGREIAAFKENDQVCMSNAEVNEDLRFLLGDAHDAFLHNVETFRRSLNEIADKLQQPVSVLNPGAMTCEEILGAQRHPDGTYQFRKRLKFAMSKSQVDSIIEELQRSSGHLTSLSDRFRDHIGSDPSGGGYSRKATKVASTLVNVQWHAQRLFNVISGTWAACHEEHQMGVRLDSRLEELRVHSYSFSRRTRSVIFWTCLGPMLDNVSPQFDWFQAHVALSDFDPGSREGGLSEATCDYIETLEGGAPAQKVTDICAFVSECSRFQRSLQLLVSVRNDLKARVPIDGAITVARPIPTPAITLAKLFSTDRASFGLNSRLFVATALVSAVLQLCGTTWIIHGPFKDRVKFPIDSFSTGDNIVQTTRTSNPFISVVHSHAEQTRGMSLKHSLLELGIVLLELWHNITLEEYFQIPAGTARSGFYERQMLASQWVDETCGNIVGRYCKAVRACIRSLDEGADLHDQTLRDDICQNVLLPLMEM